MGSVKGYRHLSGRCVVISCVPDIITLRLGEDVLDDGQGEKTRGPRLNEGGRTF